jgi:hypothetical protein
VSFSLLYFCLFGCKFEVWRKKTHLILFQAGFFFIIISFIFSYFLFLIWFLHFCNVFSFKIILLYFPFRVSFVSIPFFIVFAFFFCLCLFHALIFSIFIFLNYAFIYLFIFFFLFQKDSSFSNMFCNENNFKKLLYFCLIRYRFEVWKRKTNLIFFSCMVFFFFCHLFFLKKFVMYF